MFGGEAGFAALGAGADLPAAGLPAAGGVVEVGLSPAAAGAADLLESLDDRLFDERFWQLIFNYLALLLFNTLIIILLFLIISN